MKKKLFALLMVMVLVLTACGGTDTESTASTDTSNTAEGGKMVIGGLAPLTGAVAVYGISTTNGVQLAFDEINAAGGIAGQQVEYIVEDDKGDATESVNAYGKLMDQGIVALLGAVTSGPTKAVAEVAASDGIPMISATSTQLDITEGRPNVFRTCFTDPMQGDMLAQYAKDTLGAKTAAVLVNNSSDYSDGVAQAFIAKAKELGIEIVSEEGYAEADKDFRPQLTSIAALKPDLLLVPDYYEKIALVTSQAREVGFAGQFLGPDGWDGVVQQLDAANYGVIEGAVFSNHYAIDSTDPKVVDFVKSYTDKYGEAPTAFSALGYDTAYILKDAIEAAGSTDKEAIVEAMKAINFEGVTGKLTFDENNNPIKSVTMMSIKDGAYVFDSVVDPQN